MASNLFFGFLVFVLTGVVFGRRLSREPSFDDNYEVTWGGGHVLSFDRGREIQLSMDKSSGSGFASKLTYGSGFFRLRIKLPGRNSAGVVTAFYLSSNGSRHDELDFEFLGNKEGKPYTLQTNVFANGEGNREQRLSLWFDPTKEYHSYGVLWNSYQIVFFIDEIPIRVFMNKSYKGVGYPTHPMRVIASLWNGDDWATDGGKTKIDWTYAPFTAQFQGFNVDGCSSDMSKTSQCSSKLLWWNADKYRMLSSAQEQIYQSMKKKYMTYDYCTDVSRFKVLPPECPP
ncbi:xyloglucan endotransglucosylase/hydrolase protein 2-like [Aristolochia californica]|uniref:xyloglucan endotransglucosylase/hydrolase protein 2-like n=1 Tax=Aristolochia californica TaxID=171875 RepID=UPI0035D93211